MFLTGQPSAVHRGMAFLVFLSLGGFPISSVAQEGEDRIRPLESGLVEKATTELLQLDVLVSGPPDVISALRPEDFEIVVRRDRLVDFTLDSHCEGLAPEAQPVQREPASYIFYIDEKHLRRDNRLEFLALTRDLIPRLVNNRNRGMVIRNGRKFEVAMDFTSDAQELMAAVDRIREQPQELELTGIVSGDAGRWYSQTQTDLIRLSITLARLADTDFPKAIIYVADLFPHVLGGGNLYQSDSDRVMSTLDDLLSKAAAYGVRFYTFRPPAGRATEVLYGLATDTGGRILYGGSTASKLAEQVAADSSCMYLISFDPAELPKDKKLSVRVRVRKRKVEVLARKRVISLSPSRLLTDRILAGFVAPAASRSDFEVRIHVVPTGFSKGKFQALVQIEADPSEIPGVRWTMGASLVSRGKVRDAFSRRISINLPHVTPVLERVVSFKPGEFEVIAVSYNGTENTMGSESLKGMWPHEKKTPSVGPMTILQPTAGAFVRGEEVRTQGLLAVLQADALDPSAEALLMCILCDGNKSRKNPRSLSVRRTLIGPSEHQFQDQVIDFGEERCAFLQDVILPNTLAPGSYVYKVSMQENAQVAAENEYTFQMGEAGSR